MHLCQASDSDCEVSRGDMALLQRLGRVLAGLWDTWRENSARRGSQLLTDVGVPGSAKPGPEGWGPLWQVGRKGQKTPADTDASR